MRRMLCLLMMTLAIGCNSATLEIPRPDQSPDMDMRDAAPEGDATPDVIDLPDNSPDEPLDQDTQDSTPEDASGDTTVQDVPQDMDPAVSRLSIPQALVDNAMAIQVPSGTGVYSLGGGSTYGRNGAVMLFLSILTRDDASWQSTQGEGVRDRALAHIKRALDPQAALMLQGGHASWFDLTVPLALAIARHTPVLWDGLTMQEKQGADTLMQHALHTANMFCNANSSAPNQVSWLRADMALLNSGYLPNQTASWHAYAIGAYIYFGGIPQMNQLLTGFDLDAFRGTLQAQGYTAVDALYANPKLQSLLDGNEVMHEGRALRPDPLGVRKPLNQINTASLTGSDEGAEHPYFFAHQPVAATPFEVFKRWGHEFTVGAMPKADIGPDVFGSCQGRDLGLTSGVMPYEGQPGKGMPYELNARSAPNALPSRSSFDYSFWSMQQYKYMFATLVTLGYIQPTDPAHAPVWARAKRATEIFRYVGEHKWMSNAGPPAEKCTGTHDDAYGEFSGMHWAQALMDATLFDASFEPPAQPPVP